MKRRTEKNDQTDRTVKRFGGGRLRDWATIFLLYAFVLGIVIYAYIEDDEPISISEMISRFAVAIPGLLLIRSGMIFGILLGNFLQYIRQVPRTVEQKNALVGLAKREGAWYSGAVFSLLLFYRWTPFAGHVDVFFILAVVVPLSLIFIFALWILLVDMLHGGKF
ncbi:MAG: hypothetical protein M1283_06500 [Gammaproteobacteria bacterium]|nr:hypothetical protein [Gammaproteobacteria bacterium]